MDRRAFLAALHVALLPAGCLTAPDGGGDASTTPDGSTATPEGDRTSSTPDSDRIAIVVTNGRDATLDVTLTVTSDGDRVYRGTVAVGAGARRTVDPGIDRTGAYELTVALPDGSESVRPFDVEEYDRRTGANLIVEIGERIRILMEE
ncbi:hypothetical protein EI982_06945 [Haloplanus rallus]|uniref:Ig-like domain-containing protein n=1 Tax=Haloplanus rallus TaxID=1816183 RepID=A0A6B9F582_9EURY|nr:hypothetical protein [Haloplanus rallus]QGX94542.1 hypothetical protein EI982_06945 [Haloplanus rallus]